MLYESVIRALRALLPSPCGICHSWWCHTEQHCPTCHEIRVGYGVLCACDRASEARRIREGLEHKARQEAAALDSLADKVWERIQVKQGGSS